MCLPIQRPVGAGTTPQHASVVLLGVHLLCDALLNLTWDHELGVDQTTQEQPKASKASHPQALGRQRSGSVDHALDDGVHLVFLCCEVCYVAD
jgi:hypothetical protein